MSRDSLGYDRVAFKANADGAPINFQLHQQIRSSVSLPLTTAVAASAADLAIQLVWTWLAAAFVMAENGAFIPFQDKRSLRCEEYGPAAPSRSASRPDTAFS